MSDIQVVLRNPLNHNDTTDYFIDVDDSPLGDAWLRALRTDILGPGKSIDKSFLFLGFPNTHRNLERLCAELNDHITVINQFNESGYWNHCGLDSYVIEEWFSPESVRFPAENHRVAPNDGLMEYDRDDKYLGLRLKHDIMNRIHNHFERLQGTVWEPSQYYQFADKRTKEAIRNLNLLCHEIESLVLSQRKAVQNPNWIRPSQITTFNNATRFTLEDEHRQGFVTNRYDRKLGTVYMHWCQIGKTLMEVFRDEGAPDLDVGDDPTDITVGSGATCEAINSLKYYSGEFDIEWGRDVTEEASPWHRLEMDKFYQWLDKNGVEASPAKLSLGYLPVGTVDLQKSFGTTYYKDIWNILSSHLDILRIQSGTYRGEYDWDA